MSSLLVLGLLVACDPPRGEGVELTTWTLTDARGASSTITLPGDLALPRSVPSVRLVSEIPLDDDQRGQPLTVWVAGWRTDLDLEVGGHSLSCVDEPPFSGYRHHGVHHWRLPASLTQEPALELALTVENGWGPASQVELAPVLEPTSAGERWPTLLRLVNTFGGIIGLCGIVQIGLLYLAVYFQDRRRRLYLYFGVQAVTAAAYPMFDLGLSQGFAWDGVVVGLAITTATIVSLWFTHDQLRLPPPHRAWLALWGVGALAALAGFDRFDGPAIYGFAMASITVVVVAYQIGLAIWHTRYAEQRPVAPIIASCWLALGLCALPDMALWLGFGEIFGGIRAAGLGLSMFALPQSLLLSYRHTHMMRESEERAERAERARAEIEVLNEELRRKIGERSIELVRELARAGRTEGATCLVSGDTVADHYRVVRELGRGGMGVVYEVERVRDGRRLALKVTRSLDPGQLARLAREAAIASQLAHTHVVHVVDCDVAPEGFVYVAMEFVDGPSLRQVLDEDLGLGWRLSVLADVAAGLQALHTVGVVHRDLKIDNVLLERTEGGLVAKVTDFGISRLGTTTELTELTATGFVAGTPPYLPPEVIDPTRPPTPSMDMFSFGVLATRMLTACFPFAIPPLYAARDGYEPIRDTTAWRRLERYPELLELVTACLSFDPDQRPTAAAAAATLERLVAGTSAGEEVVGVDAEPLSSGAASTRFVSGLLEDEGDG